GALRHGIGRHVFALRARAIRLGAVELFVRARYRILAIVGDVRDALVELRAALLAEPREAIVLAAAPLALEDEHERLGGKARGVRRARGAVDDLAFLDDHNLLHPVRCPIVEVHVALDHVHDLVARVAVELAPELPPARDERDAFPRLPQHGVRAAGALDRRYDLSRA